MDFDEFYKDVRLGSRWYDELDWYACDRDGCIAVLMTIGQGLVPRSILDERLYRVHEFIRYGSEILVEYGNDEGVAFERRGVHGFENQLCFTWKRSDIGRYARTIEPSDASLRVGDVPAELRSYFDVVRFDGLWRETRDIDVRSAFPQIDDWNV